MLSERLGKWQFWLMVVGMNLTFGPMHIVGLQGQPRRMYTYQDGYGLATWNLIETIGSLILAVGILLFLINAVRTNGLFGQKQRTAPLDPWDARSLEWMTASPPKEHNFDQIPVVSTLDEFFYRKYAEDHETGEIRAVSSAEDLLAEQERNADKHIHMPSPSYWPIVAAFGLPMIALGVIFKTIPVCVIGAAIVILGIYGWVLEPSVADDSDYDPPTPAGTSKELTPVG